MQVVGGTVRKAAHLATAALLGPSGTVLVDDPPLDAAREPVVEGALRLRLELVEALEDLEQGLLHEIVEVMSTVRGPPEPEADDAPHARLSEIRVDGDFHEHGPEGMHGESLRFVAGLDVGGGLDRLAEAAHGIGEVVGAAARKRVLARFAARGLHGAADARHRHRAAMHGRSRQPGIAETEPHPRDGEAESLGRNLGHGCPGTRPHVAGRARHLGGAVRQ